MDPQRAAPYLCPKKRTFDTGDISIKPIAEMAEMKRGMAVSDPADRHRHGFDLVTASVVGLSPKALRRSSRAGECFNQSRKEEGIESKA